MEHQQPDCSCGRIRQLSQDYPDLFTYDEPLQMYLLQLGDWKNVIRYCFQCGEPVFFKQQKELNPVIHNEVKELASQLKNIDDVFRLLGEPDFIGHINSENNNNRSLNYHNIWPEVSLYLVEREDGSISFSYALK